MAYAQTTTVAIPDEALDTHIGVLGRTGTGKTYTARGLVERLLDAKRQVVIIDPTSAWWGLRSVYPIPIFGGQHGDIEITDASGRAVAETILSNGTSAIVDLSLLARQSGAAMRRFMTALVARLKDKDRGALWLVIDEADEFLPQVLSPDMTHLFGDLKWIVRRGRIAGWRVMMITQRPQDIAKSVLTQIGTLVAHRLTAPQDRKAVEEWVKGHADSEEAKAVLTSLASLARGEAWAWSPEHELLIRAKMPPIKSFDSGATPDADSGAVEQPALTAIDMSAIRKTLDAGGADRESTCKVSSQASDPSAEIGRLRARIADLEVERDEWTFERATGQQRLDALVAELALTSDALERVTELLGRAGQLINGLPRHIRLAGTAELTAEEPVAVSDASPKVENRKVPSGINLAERDGTARQVGTPPRDTKLGAERRPLAALAQVYPSGLTEPQWATSAGMKRSGGTWGTYKSRLRSGGLIEQRDGRWFATGSGAAITGPVDLPPAPGPDLARWWAGKLPSVGPMTEALIEAWPHWLTRDELAQRLDMTASGGSFGTYLSRLSGPGLIERDGKGIRLCSDVMRRVA